MKIEPKINKLTWRKLRLRYEIMQPIKGLRGINLISAFDHNLKLLEDLYQSSDFIKQFPESKQYEKYKEERIAELKKLPSVLEEQSQDGQMFLKVNWQDQSVKDVMKKIENKYKSELEKRQADSEDYDKLLDEEVPTEFIKFWKVSFTEAPQDQESYQAIEWFLKDKPGE